MKLSSALTLSTPLLLICFCSLGCDLGKPAKKSLSKRLAEIASSNSGTAKAPGWKTVKSEEWKCTAGIREGDEFSDRLMIMELGKPFMSMDMEKVQLKVDAPTFAENSIRGILRTGREYHSDVKVSEDGTFCRSFVLMSNKDAVLGRIYVRQDAYWVILGFVDREKEFDDTELRYFFDHFQVTP